MKTQRTLLWLLTGLSLGFIFVGCKGGRPVPVPVAGGYYFAFADKDKAALLATDSPTIERVNWQDSTKVVRSMKIRISGGDVGSNRDYTYMFSLPKGDSVAVEGWNRFRLVYPGKAEADWLVFFNPSKNIWWPQPEQVMFNGKPIPVRVVDEPTPPSNLYVLQ